MNYNGLYYPVAAGALRMFPRALAEVASVSEAGSLKYNVAVGEMAEILDPFNKWTEAMISHFLKEDLEDGIDEEDGQLHAAKVAWNALARLEHMMKEAEG